MALLKNDLFLRAAQLKPVEQTPIWIMRQAGRYLPEYRAARKRAGSFMTLCKTPELACEVTLQPIQRFPLDAAILFSDILTIPDAMGLGLYFIEGEGPQFKKSIRTLKDVRMLGVPDPARDLRYVLDAVAMIRHELAEKIPLIGFCGSPWTLATYMVEGRANKSFLFIQEMMKAEPATLHVLLDLLADSVIVHLNAQIIAGAQAVMIFDTWGGMLNTENYQTYSLYYIQKIISGLIREHQQQVIPCILFTKQGGQWLESMAQTGCNVIGVDWNITLQEARARVGTRVALQGNMNPAILLENPALIRSEVERILSEYGTGTGHIFNLGHGITPDVPPENVAELVNAVHELSRRFHATK